MKTGSFCSRFSFAYPSKIDDVFQTDLGFGQRQPHGRRFPILADQAVGRETAQLPKLRQAKTYPMGKIIPATHRATLKRETFDINRKFGDLPYSRDWIGSKMVEGPYL